MNTELTHLSLIHVKRACLIQINENVVRWLTFKITAKNRKSKDSYHKRRQIGREQNRHASRQPKAKQQHQRAAADRLGIGPISGGGQGKSGDGGETWAKANAENDPEADGLEAAYLDILFLDHKTGFIVGSYGKLLHTRDGGESWTVAKQEDDPHFSHITPAPDGGLWLCGEYGTVWRSPDRGANWQPRMTPYDGTFFGVIPLARGGAVVFGLRGKIFRSEDGTEWERIESRTKALLHGGLALADGRLVLAAGAGQLLLSADGGRTFRLGSIAVDKTATVTSLWQAADGGVLLTSDKGVYRLELADIVF